MSTIKPERTAPAAAPIYQPLLTIDQVADWLCVSVQTIYSWRKRGIGPVALKVGKHLRYRPSDVEQFIADCAREAMYGDSNYAGSGAASPVG